MISRKLTPMSFLARVMRSGAGLPGSVLLEEDDHAVEHLERVLPRAEFAARRTGRGARCVSGAHVTRQAGCARRIAIDCGLAFRPANRGAAHAVQECGDGAQPRQVDRVASPGALGKQRSEAGQPGWHLEHRLQDFGRVGLDGGESAFDLRLRIAGVARRGQRVEGHRHIAHSDQADAARDAQAGVVQVAQHHALVGERRQRIEAHGGIVVVVGIERSGCMPSQ